jgi:hypothetical protein
LPGVESTSTVPSPVDVPARLSSAQKRDLLGQTVAAVITTALIAAPFITPPAGSGDVSSETTLPAQSLVSVVPSVTAVSRGVPVRKIQRPRAATRAAATVAPWYVRASVDADRTLMATAMPAMTLQPQVVATAGDTRGDRDTARRPLSRRLTGWLTGDGSVTVRPFPTLATAR